MPYSLLYYPKFEPDQRWLRSVLLFVDEVSRIIPADAGHEDSSKMRELLEWLPDSIKTISPTPSDTYFDPANMERLDRVCKKIHDDAEGRSLKSFRLPPVHRSRSASTKRNVWISKAKLSAPVLEMLSKYNLAAPLSDGMMPMNEAAADLIVSYVADRMAMRIGTDTITDAALPHAVQTLDALGVSASSQEREKEGLLTAAIANLVVPARIEEMSLPSYQELRQRFSEIRAPFHELIRSLAAHRNLNRQESAVATERRIEQAVQDYKVKMDAFRRSRVSEKVDEWTPFAIGGLIMFLSRFAPPDLQLLMTLGGLSVAAMQKCYTKPEIAQGGTFQLLCKMEKEIYSKGDLTSLI